MNSTDDVENQQKKGRKTLLLVLALFLLPILVVLVMYQLSLRPGGASYGELVTPPRQLHFATLMTWQNKPFSEAMLRDKWSMLYVTPAVCDEQCTGHVRMMRQIHMALGKEIERLQRVVLITKTPLDDQINAMQRDYPDLIILSAPAGEVVKLAEQIDGPIGNGGDTYLIDPLGNVMMHYVPMADPSGIRKDLAKLLRYSWAG